MSVFDKFSNAIVYLCFFALVAATSYHVFDTQRRQDVIPVHIVDLELETPVVEAGGEVRYVFSFLREKYCKSLVYRILLSKEENEIRTVLDRDQVITGATDLGRISKRRWLYTVPKDLPPGEYTLTHLYHSDCGDYIHSDRAPQITFTVVPKPSPPMTTTPKGKPK
jgi:hypothetical protein